MVPLRSKRLGALRLTELFGVVGLLLLGLAWLVPNKQAPWLSFWNEAVAGAAVLLLVCAAWGASRRAVSLPPLAWPWAALLVLGVCSVWGQWAMGLLMYSGDAWVVSLYLALFALAVVSGRVLTQGPDGFGWRTALLLVVLAAGALSAGIVLMQWLWADPLVVFAQETTLGGQPYASLGQPNHASTLFFLALCCALQLRREQVIGRTATALAALLLTLTMALTQSRTGIVQSLVLLVWCVWSTNSAKQTRPWRWGVFVLALTAMWWALMPLAHDTLLLPGGVRDLHASTSSGRAAMWLAFTEALLQRPWGGWGWLQSGLAQQSVAACHPGVHLYFSYTHLLPLDLMLWLGIPMGLLLMGLLLYGLWPHLSRRGSGLAGYWLVAVLGLGAHAVLEYPLAYLYFLVPAGLMLGVMDAMNPERRAWRMRTSVLALGGLAAAGVAAVALHDIVLVTDAYTEIRFAQARIGAHRVNAPAVPAVWALDQLEGLVKVRATDTSAPLDSAELEQLGKAVRRAPLDGVALRYAQLLALSGHTDASAVEQQPLCDLNGAERCAVAAWRWNEWRSTSRAELPTFSGSALRAHCTADR